MKATDDFLMREITHTGEEYPDMIKVTRTRTSQGFGSIHITCGNQRIVLTNEKPVGDDLPHNKNVGGDYEAIARELAETIEAVTMDSCLLPALKS